MLEISVLFTRQGGLLRCGLVPLVGSGFVMAGPGRWR